jgi:hypothetical protein
MHSGLTQHAGVPVISWNSREEHRLYGSAEHPSEVMKLSTDPAIKRRAEKLPVFILFFTVPIG